MKTTKPSATGRKKIPIDLLKVEQFAQVCDNEAEIATALGVSYSTLKNRKRELALFDQAIKRGRAKANVFVGGKLMDKIKEGNIAAMIFYLKSRCGWVEKSSIDHTSSDGSMSPKAMTPKEIAAELIAQSESMDDE